MSRAVGPLPLRGEVWDVRFPQPVGDHKALILSINALRVSLSAITVAVITGTEGPRHTHVPVGPDAGLTRYDESFVNVTDLHTASARFRRRRGLLSPDELSHVERAVRLVLGL